MTLGTRSPSPRSAHNQNWSEWPHNHAAVNRRQSPRQTAKSASLQLTCKCKRNAFLSLKICMWDEAIFLFLHPRLPGSDPSQDGVFLLILGPMISLKSQRDSTSSFAYARYSPAYRFMVHLIQKSLSSEILRLGFAYQGRGVNKPVPRMLALKVEYNSLNGRALTFAIALNLCQPRITQEILSTYVTAPSCPRLHGEAKKRNEILSTWYIQISSHNLGLMCNAIWYIRIINMLSSRMIADLLSMTTSSFGLNVPQYVYNLSCLAAQQRSTS